MTAHPRADFDGQDGQDELEALRRANADLVVRLQEAEDTLAAIRDGDVDALIVGEDIYTLDSANAASNEMRKGVLAQMQDAVLAFDVDDHLIFMNPAAEAQYGRSASEMLGRPREELYRERWADAADALRARRELREQGSYRAQSLHVCADGREIHVEALVSPLRDAGGQHLGALCVIRDVGERVRTEATLAAAAVELARRERQFATLVENSPDIFARVDRELRLLYVSPVIERYIGGAPAAYLGRGNPDLGLPAVLLESWGRAFESVFATGQVDRLKFRFTAKEGHAVDFDARLIPEFAEDGRIESVLVIASNVTEQELADAALRESKARLEFTLAAARIGDWEIDVASGACRHSTLFDRCFGFEAPQVPWNLAVMLSHVHAADRERVRAQVARCFETRADLDFECRVVWPDDGVHWIDVHGSAYVSTRAEEVDASPRLRYLGIIADVTARKHDEDALRDADVRKDEFLAMLAHELRNPLAPIRNAVQIMQLSRDERVHENARRVIERQLKQMVHLVDDLLDVSRISQGKVELRREQVDLASVVTTAIETSRPLIDAGHHALSVTLPPPGELLVDGDVTRLCQILANLLNNAAKYTPDGGRIDVVLRHEGTQAAIRVRDSGIGIAREMLPRVFDMFAQVDRSSTRAQGGLGIGLALVKRLVEMHGGSVGAASEGPGRGCCFVVRLPLIARVDQRKQAMAGHPLLAGQASTQRVLVVDDNVDSAESLAQVLQILGYETTTAHDGVAAVDAVQAWRPAIVLLDIGMPRMNGLEAARAIRALPGGDSLVLIALSGWGQHEDRRKSREAGFDHHFVKPLDVEVLIDLLGTVAPRPPVQ